jgi:hypothetical protein
MARLFAILLVCMLALGSQAQQASTPTQFAVLRTDRVVVHTGEGEHLTCSITGSGDAAQINCDSQTGKRGPTCLSHRSRGRIKSRWVYRFLRRRPGLEDSLSSAFSRPSA